MALFTVAIFSTFIPEYLHGFFGDRYCYEPIKGCKDTVARYEYQPHYHWGYRHWLYFVMTLILFILQAVRIIEYVSNEEVKK